MDIHKVTEGNRLAWDETATKHRELPQWEKLKSGFSSPAFSTFDKTITDVLTELPIQGKSVVQIGCNNGRELLSAMALGANTGIGIDQSGKFIEQANELTRISGRDCNYINANVYDLPASVPTDFDVALITIGVLNWMPDLATFFSVVANLLGASGKLVIYETHPFMEMFEPAAKNPYELHNSYFSTDPYILEETFVYDDAEPSEAPRSYWFIHRIGEIVNATVHAGLDIKSLVEYPHSNREPEYDVYADQTAQIPMCFSLVAQKA